MKYRTTVMALLAAASLGATIAAPAFAASHFNTIKYARIPTTVGPQGVVLHDQVVLTPAQAGFASDDDRTWTLTLNNCALRIGGDGLALSADDAAYKKSFEQGVAEGKNPLNLELVYDGRAEFARDTPGATDAPFACDAHHLYWLSVLRVPSVPGYAVLELMSFDGYKPQETEQRLLLLAPDTFLQGDTTPPAQLGALTAALAKAIGK